MSSDEMIERIMDWLSGELTPREEQELQDILGADLEMDRQARELKRVWDMLEEALLEPAQQKSVLQHVYQLITEGLDQGQLSDDDLDQAAGGIGHDVPSWLKKDSGHGK